MTNTASKLRCQYGAHQPNKATLNDKGFVWHPAYLHPKTRQAFRELAQQMMRSLGADLCALFSWDDEQQGLVFLQAFDKQNVPMAWNGYASALIAAPAMQSALQSGLSVSIQAEPSNTAPEQAVLEHFGCQTMVLVPVGDANARVGVICLLLGPHSHRPAEREIRLLDALATMGKSLIDQQGRLSSQHQLAGRPPGRQWHKSGFLLALSRDLRTPLSTIMGLTELIRIGSRGELPDDLAYSLERVVCNAGLLMDTVNELVEWGRGGLGHFMLYPEWLDLPAMLNSAIPLWETIVADTSGSLTRRIMLQCPTSLPLVFVDSARIRQAISNLVMTIRNISKAGDIHIACQEIQVSQGQVSLGGQPRTLRLPDGQWVMVSVAGKAAGVSQTTIERLAAACRQPSGHENTWPDGSLGLVIAKRLLALHGSIVWVERLNPRLQGQDQLSTCGEQGRVALAFALPSHPQQVWTGRRWQGMEATIQ